MIAVSPVVAGLGLAAVSFAHASASPLAAAGAAALGVIAMTLSITVRSPAAAMIGVALFAGSWVGGEPSSTGLATAGFALALLVLAELSFAALGTMPTRASFRLASLGRALAIASVPTLIAAAFASGGPQGDWLLFVGCGAVVVAVGVVVWVSDRATAV